MSQPHRLIIADPGLTGPLGHHLSYSAAVAGAAIRAGVPTLVLAGRGFDGAFESEGIETRAVLGSAYQTAGGGGLVRRCIFGLAAHLPGPFAAFVGPAVRNLRRKLPPFARDGLGRELAAQLAHFGAGPADMLLLHSVSGANLFSLCDAQLPPVTLLVVLRRMPAEMEADDPAPELLVALFQRLADRFGQRLRLFADTQTLAAQFHQLSGLQVRPVPLPVAVPGVLCRPLPAVPHLVFAGGARLEKGYARLPAALAALAGRARFTIQSGPISPAADPLVQRAHRALREASGPQLVLIEEALEPPAYAALLASADLLLLPYDGRIYGARSSGILAEALALGIPAVVPAGCWMEDAAGSARAVAVPSDRMLGSCLMEALDRLPAITHAARQAAPAWRMEHSPEALWNALTGPV